MSAPFLRRPAHPGRWPPTDYRAYRRAEAAPCGHGSGERFGTGWGLTPQTGQVSLRRWAGSGEGALIVMASHYGVQMAD
jgi:hypothetical protein